MTFARLALLLALLPLADRAAAAALDPADMESCISAEADTILDALAATRGAAETGPVALGAAYGESFANCNRVPEVTLWQGCFAEDDALGCLTGLADAAAAAVPLERAAARLLASEHGETEAMDSLPAAEAALTAFEEGIGGAARRGCEGRQRDGIPSEQNLQACRILFELGRYASWRGGQLLFEARDGLAGRNAPEPRLSVDRGCMRAQVEDALERMATASADNPGGAAMAPGQGALVFMGCSNGVDLVSRCFAPGTDTDACARSLWRQTRAERIARRLAVERTLPQEMIGGLALVRALETRLMEQCLAGEGLEGLAPNTGWAICSISTGANMAAMYRGLAYMDEVAQ